MPSIRKLSSSLQNLIAAGEVVENMASVVKELVENSIDANATQIRVDLKESGLREIKVTDNGSGMVEDDVLLSLERHATSKISTSHDLFHIDSLGFRGEAIPSIASVSHMEIISSTGEDGLHVSLKQGKIIEQKPAPLKQGTLIVVKNLFYNTPARLKHLKATNTELSYIVEFIHHIALSYPSISFMLTNDEKAIFQSSGTNNILKVLAEIYSVKLVKEMVPFDNKNGYFTISGYFVKPATYRSTRNHITIIVNHRVISNSSIKRAVTDAFKTYIPINKYPIVFLHITLDPLMIDVNVHPQKKEVKFTEERLLRSLITSTIFNQLQSLDLTPRKRPNEVKSETTIKQPTLDFSTERLQENSSEYKTKEHQQVQKRKENNEEKSKNTLFSDMDYIGQLLGTYLLFQNNEGLYVIDQHAAAERIRYERYVKRMSEPTSEYYELLLPLELDLSKQELIQLEESLEELAQFGLILQISGNTIEITHVPNWFIKGYETIYAEEMVQYVLDEKDLHVKDVVDSMAKSLSCKHSIKANHYINEAEVSKILHDLARCKNPYHCPHGRPTIVLISEYDLEKLFKRVM